MTTQAQRPVSPSGASYDGTRAPAAPLPRAGIERALAPFGESRMLPVAAYRDPAVLAWERDAFFSSWSCVGRAEQVAAPRSAAAFAAAGDGAGVLVTRDADGGLHAFDNACRHRGHELLPCGGAAQGRLVACPYHAWTYEHTGALRNAPRFPKDGSFDPAAFALKPVPVVDWHGWLFVDPGGRGGDFATHVGELEAVVAPYQAAGMVTVASHDYEIAANWKVVVENYQECYHCPSIHPELVRVSPPHSGENIEREGSWVGGWMALRDGAETMSLDGRGGRPQSQLSAQEQRSVMYVAVMPNLLISLHPDYVMTHVLTPLTPERTRITCSWAFPRAAAQAPGFDPSYAVDFWDLTNRQDWAACESVQRGMATPGFEPGPLAPDEDGVYQFVAMIAQRYLTG